MTLTKQTTIFIYKIEGNSEVKSVHIEECDNKINDITMFSEENEIVNNTYSEALDAFLAVLDLHRSENER